MTAAATLAASLGVWLGIIGVEASKAGVEWDVLAVVCHYETRGNIDKAGAVGDDGASLGICQVKVQTAQEMGYRGPAEGLKDPVTNIRYAARWLRHCVDLGAASVRRQAECYNAGRLGRAKTLYASRVHNMVMRLRMEAGYGRNR